MYMCFWSVQILLPMMLRRLKEDVEKSLAPKEETIVEVCFLSLLYCTHCMLCTHTRVRHIEQLLDVRSHARFGLSLST